MLQSRAECIKIQIRDGWLICPRCRRFKLARIRADTWARNLPVYCRNCHEERVVNIEQSQCFQSRS